jgi:putative heme transporter
MTRSLLTRWGRASWYLVGIAVLAVAAGWLVWRIRLVVMPLFVAILLAVVLLPLSRWLIRKGLTRTLAATTSVVFLVLVAATVGFFVAPALIDQFRSLGAELTRAGDRLESWVAAERPFGLDQADVRRWRQELSALGPESTQSLIEGARAIGSFIAALLFTIVATFFFVRDGNEMVDWAVDQLPTSARADGRAALSEIANALNGYVRGAAVLGAVEGVAVTVALALVGSDAPIVIGVLTFVAAFVPFIGAIVAGAIAVGVALVSAGTGGALIVAAVVLVIQQLDNDLLAPIIYGRFLKVHPLALLASLSVGIQTAGLIGAFASVPLAASAVGVARVIRRRERRAPLTLPTEEQPSLLLPGSQAN